MSTELGLVMIKPDGVEKGLTGKILHRFEERGLQLVAIRMVQGTEAQFTAMYYSKQVYGFWEELLAFLLSGPVVPAVLAGADASQRIRGVLGEKDPLDSLPGTIRGSLSAQDRIRTLCHGSRSPEEAASECAIWFPGEFPGLVVPAAERPSAEDPYAAGELSAFGSEDAWEGAFEPVLVKIAPPAAWPCLEEQSRW